MFNLQSGQHRRRFPAKLTPAQARDQQIREEQTGTMSSVATGERLKFGRGHGKHVKAVTGLMVDSVNQTVVSCGLDGKVKVSASPSLPRKSVANSRLYPSSGTS